MNWMGIDYGKKHVGIATSQGEMAQALTTISNHGVLETVRALGEKYLVNKIVIGLPEGRLREEVKSFAKKLEDLGFQVFLWDETLTSFTAQDMLVQTNTSRKKRKEKQHEVAAALILQTYLDSQK